jgi:glycosyltransferase involved in cell wall biosynthesis
MRITTIIPAYNSSKTLEKTLAGINRQSRLSDQVIVVGDGSVDDIAPIVCKFPSVEYHHK